MDLTGPLGLFFFNLPDGTVLDLLGPLRRAFVHVCKCLTRF